MNRRIRAPTTVVSYTPDRQPRLPVERETRHVFLIDRHDARHLHDPAQNPVLAQRIKQRPVPAVVVRPLQPRRTPRSREPAYLDQSRVPDHHFPLPSGCARARRRSAPRERHQSG